MQKQDNRIYQKYTSLAYDFSTSQADRFTTGLSHTLTDKHTRTQPNTTHRV